MIDVSNINFNNSDGLVPVTIQDENTDAVLMLGYMNRDALEHTINSGLVTFYSRSKGRLWTKGESSGNSLQVSSISVDCDQDAMLIRAIPKGPTCHTGDQSCFRQNPPINSFLRELEETIRERKESDHKQSYTSSLFKSGLPKIAQKVGEEATEVIIAAIAEDEEAFKGECADLLFHLLVLLRAKNLELNDVLNVLQDRQLVRQRTKGD
jgi:phosphoribosyl-ATP pyrophosphohydrolase/phosphoribosyl-AMP cyclohydrolase